LKKIITDQPQRVGEFVSRLMGNDGWSSYQAIGLEEDGELIAGVLFDNYNGASICMHVAAVPGKRWMSREYLWYCFYYPFMELKVKRITGLVPESNLAARRFDEHLGFQLEARLKDAAPDGDVLVYRMMKADCKFLEMKHV
jgi:RimJ/RimL family protein N-acetyltransferase